MRKEKKNFQILSTIFFEEIPTYTTKKTTTADRIFD